MSLIKRINWPPVLAIVAAVSVALAIVLGFIVKIQMGKIADLKQALEVKAIVVQVAATINTDSLKTATERKVIDSLQPVITDLQIRIKSISNENKQIRKQNNALRIGFDTLRVNRPDF